MAYYLNKKGQQFELHEVSSKSGGKIQTEENEYGLVEQAANAIYTNDIVQELIDELELKTLVVPKNLKKYIYLKNKFRTWPFGFFETLMIMFKLFKKIPAEATKNTASVYDFFAPLLGEFHSRETLSTALQGIYATSSQELHFRSTFKTGDTSKTYLYFLVSYFKSKKKYNKRFGASRSISFENGMKEFIKKLTSKIQNKIYYNSSPELSSDYNNIICTDAFTAGVLLDKKNQKLSLLLKEITYTPLTSQTIFLKKPLFQLENSFGALFSLEKNFKLMGIVNNNALFPKRSKSKIYSYTLIGQQNDLTNELKQLRGYKPENILAAQGKIWKKAIPIYNVERKMIIDSSKQVLLPGTLLFGNYTGSLSLRELITSAYEFVEGLKK